MLAVSPLMRRRATRLASLGLAAAIIAAPMVASGARSKRGTVRYVTATRVYVDVGRANRLGPGDKLNLQRLGRAVGDCVIQQVSEHSAVCINRNAKRGDTFSVSAELPKERSPGPSLPSDQELADAHARVTEAPVEKVDFHGKAPQSGTGLPLFSVTAQHTAYLSFGQSGFEETRLDLSVNGVNLHFGGLRGFAHVTALIYSDRPSTTRFRPSDRYQVYVWETGLVSREIGRPFVLSVGRIWPYHAPGLTLIDGAQAGWRSKDGAYEAGVVGGTIPDADTLYPSYQRWTAGVYYGASHVGHRGSILRLLRHEARLSVRGNQSIGPQLELEALMQMWLATVADMGADARVAIGGNDWSTPRLEAGRFSFGVRATRWLRVIGTFRYLGPRPADYDSFSTGLFSNGQWFYGNLDLTADATSWLKVSLLGGAAEESGSSNQREYVGGELSAPTLLRHRGGVSVGYREELSWMAGRTAYVQLFADPVEKVRLLIRTSYFGTGDQHDLSAFLSADARIIRWLYFRTSAMARVGLSQGAGIPSQGTLAGLVLRADLTGSF